MEEWNNKIGGGVEGTLGPNALRAEDLESYLRTNTSKNLPLNLRLFSLLF